MNRFCVIYYLLFILIASFNFKITRAYNYCFSTKFIEKNVTKGSGNIIKTYQTKATVLHNWYQAAACCKSKGLNLCNINGPGDLKGYYDLMQGLPERVRALIGWSDVHGYSNDWRNLKGNYVRGGSELFQETTPATKGHCKSIELQSKSKYFYLHNLKCDSIGTRKYFFCEEDDPAVPNYNYNCDNLISEDVLSEKKDNVKSYYETILKDNPNCDLKQTTAAPTPTTAATTPTPAATTPTPTPAATTQTPTPAATTQTPTTAATTQTPTTAATTQTPTPAATTPTPAATTQTPTPAATTPTQTPAATTQIHTPAATTQTPTPAATTQTPTPAATTPTQTPAATTQTPTPAATTPTQTPAATTPTPAATAPTPTPPPRPTGEGAPDGSWCNTSICEIEVGCRSYRLCQRTDPTGNPDITNGTLVTIFCEKNYFVVPVNVLNMEPGNVAVAFCEKWEDLSTERQQEILTEEECSYCDLIPQGLCTSQFRYRNSTGVLGEIENCPLNLIIDPFQKSCVQPCETQGAIRAACVSNGKCTS